MAKTNVKVIDRDLGWHEVMREISRMDKSYTKVGFPQEGNPADGDSATMSEVATIAAVHEFGAPKRNIPMRSFLRTGIDESKKQLADIQTKQAGLVIDGKITVKTALGRIGEFGKSRVQRKITTGPFEILSERTIAARTKPSTKPLIDTGQMRSSVQHVEVINGRN